MGPKADIPRRTCPECLLCPQLRKFSGRAHYGDFVPGGDIPSIYGDPATLTIGRATFTIGAILDLWIEVKGNESGFVQEAWY